MKTRQTHPGNPALGLQCVWYLVTQGSQGRWDYRGAQQETLKKLRLNLEKKSGECFEDVLWCVETLVSKCECYCYREGPQLMCGKVHTDLFI